MAGVKPVVTAGGDDFLFSGRGRHRRRFGKTFQIVRRKNAPGDFVCRSQLLARGVRRQARVRPKVRLQVFRQRVEIGRGISFNHAADVADGVQKILPFGQRKFRRLAGELLQRFVRPEQDGQFSEFRRFFQKAQVARLDVIEPAADHDLQLIPHFLRLDFQRVCDPAWQFFRQRDMQAVFVAGEF